MRASLSCQLDRGTVLRRNSPNIRFYSVPRKISRVRDTLRSADLEPQYSLKGNGSLVREDVEGGRCPIFRACSRQRCLIVKAVRQLGMFRSSVNRLLPLRRGFKMVSLHLSLADMVRRIRLREDPHPSRGSRAIGSVASIHFAFSFGDAGQDSSTPISLPRLTPAQRPLNGRSRRLSHLVIVRSTVYRRDLVMNGS